MLRVYAIIVPFINKISKNSFITLDNIEQKKYAIDKTSKKIYYTEISLS